jgi:hypothetical protein
MAAEFSPKAGKFAVSVAILRQRRGARHGKAVVHIRRAETKSSVPR